MYPLKVMILSLIIGTLGVPLISSCLNGYKCCSWILGQVTEPSYLSEQNLKQDLEKSGLPSFLMNSWDDIKQNDDVAFISLKAPAHEIHELAASLNKQLDEKSIRNIDAVTLGKKAHYSFSITSLFPKPGETETDTPSPDELLESTILRLS